MMDKECKEKLEMEEHFLVSESVQNRGEDFEVFGFHSEMARVLVVAQGDGETSTRRKTAEGGLKRS